MYVETTSESTAPDTVDRIYSLERDTLGFVTEATRALSARADLLAPIFELRQQLRESFSLGAVNFRLIGLIAAKHVPSSHLSHVSFSLVARDFGRDKALAVHRDFRNAELTPVQVEMLSYTEQIAVDASRISLLDINRMREVGLTDINIADVAFAAAFTCFLGRYLDAVGAEVDAAFLDLNPAIRSELTVGKPL